MTAIRGRVLATAGMAVLCALPAPSALADEDWSLHAQSTFIEQFHPRFHAAYSGANSLDPGSRGDETFDATLYAGARLWRGGEIYVDPEIDQGFGLSDTLGLAGFSNGEGAKVGKANPYLRIPRLFFRQSFDLGGAEQTVAPDINQLGTTRTADSIVVTLGKFSVTDIFDNNTYAHDPKHDFLNWAVVDAGSFDYAADAWGYSYGGAVEWTDAWWTLRAGLFNLSRQPNGTALQRNFSQYEAVLEGEARYRLSGRPGTLRLTGFVNRGRMGDYNDALAQAGPPDTARVRRMASRPGVSLNLEQQLADGLGLFARLGVNDGSKEAYEYTEINRTAELGLSLNGGAWGRPDDTLAIAGAVNALSQAARRYFAAGGLGILIGDGALRYGSEDIVESYYAAQISPWLTASLDYQFVAHPAYNRDRGPVSIFGLRLHAQM